MSKQKNQVNDLLAAKRQPTNATPDRAETEVPLNKAPELVEPAKKAAAKAAPAKEKAKSRKGKPVQFWMHDEDRKLVRELSAWLARQGDGRASYVKQDIARFDYHVREPVRLHITYMRKICVPETVVIDIQAADQGYPIRYICLLSAQRCRTTAYLRR